MPKPMNKFLKFTLIGGGAFLGLLVLLVAAAAIIIPRKFPPEKLRAMASEELSKALHHKVTLGDVRFDILSGFQIKNLKIANRAGWAESPILAAKEISISYDLFPLLWGQISLGEVKINQPQILVQRRGLDNFNFTDMFAEEVPAGAKNAGNKSSKAGADSAKEDKKPGGDLPLITVGNINILHGKMEYRDEMVKPAQRYNLNDLNFKVKNISLVGGKTTFSLNTPFTYEKMPYVLSVEGAFRYFYSGQAFKEVFVKGSVNDLGFQISGDMKNLETDFTPNLDGKASLDMLKFSGLLPRSLSSMPKGLSFSGPADVVFHLGGTVKKGLKLSGKADGANLAVKYEDLFFKEPKTTCNVEFTSVMAPDYFELSSFHATYKEWETEGSFHYHNGSYYSGSIRSKSLPLKGLSAVIPRWKDVSITGEMALNFSVSQYFNKPKTLKMNGRADLKDFGFSTAKAPHTLEGVTCAAIMKESLVQIPAFGFKTFDGKGTASGTINLATAPLSYSNLQMNIKNVSAQQAVNGYLQVFADKSKADFVDKFYGALNIDFKGAGAGLSMAEVEKNLTGTGVFDLTQAKFKGLTAVKTINKLFNDKSDEITVAKVDGTYAIKKGVVSFSANTSDKVGTMKAKGGINFDGVYTPDMKVIGDIKKEFLDKDALKSVLSPEMQAKWDVNCIADDKGYVPVDFKFKGKASENNYDYIPERLIKNIVNCLAKEGVKALGNALGDLFKKKEK
jgi:hypothetical protein